MPQSPMESNTQETESAGRKRSHIEFSADLVKEGIGADMKAVALVPPPVSHDDAASPLNGSAAPTETGSSSPTPTSHSSQTPSKSVSPQEAHDDNRSATSASKPVVKRKRLTPQEKEVRDKDLAEKKREREAQAANRAAEKAKQDEEKAARAKERDGKRKKKEDEDRAKAEKKRKRDEEQQRVQAEKDKKARSQTKLNNFFHGMPKKATAESSSSSVSPGKTESAPLESKPRPSVYEQLFKPFFVKTDTRWTESIAQMGPEAREAKARLLDDFISGRRELEDTPMSFDAEKLLRLPCKMPKRGRLHHPVRHIMETACKEAKKLQSAGLVASDDAFEDARRNLAKVPMKVIAFSQDVRPPYYGTATLKPFALGQRNMYRLARKSSRRRLPLDYDYDSEAEWQDDEGEDVDIDDDDDEQEDEDDMEGFLDDSEDAGLARRVFANTMEPESSGIRFEDQPGGSDGKLDAYKMEFMHDGTWGIDPWSAQYWEPEQKKKAKSEEGTKMAPPPAPVNGFEAIRNIAEAEPAKLVKTELWDDVKRVILNNKALSKGSIIDIIFHQFRDSVSRAEVKNTIELFAEKKGPGRSKEWDLKPKYKIEL